MSEAQDLIRAALKDARLPCLTSSFQAECVVLTHMLRQVRPDVPVLFLDTFHHFAETLSYRDELTKKWNLPLVNLRAAEPRVGLWQIESTDACCRRHKVGPLFSALERYDVWFTALRRDQAASRANLQHDEPFRLPSGKSIRRISPLAAWTAKDVWPTRSSTTSRFCLCTKRDTRASAASRARRCPSIRIILDQAAGQVRSWSAGSIFRPGKPERPRHPRAWRARTTESPAMGDTTRRSRMSNTVRRWPRRSSLTSGDDVVTITRSSAGRTKMYWPP
jgi:phosphoadenosine phosphosulfate reductase